MLRKKLYAIAICLISAISLSSLFVGCGRNPAVTLDKRNGEPTAEVQLPHRNEYYYDGDYMFPAPSRSGWFFDRWYLDENCTEIVPDGYNITRDTTFYAGWVDSITVPGYVPDRLIKSYDDLFSLDVTAEPYGYMYGLPLIKFTVNVTPKGDFTGENSADRIELQIGYSWLSDEKFLDEYVSDEVLSYIDFRDVWLEKENGYALKNKVFIKDYNPEHWDFPIYDYTFANERTEAKIEYVFGEPTLQYKH